MDLTRLHVLRIPARRRRTARGAWGKRRYELCATAPLRFRRAYVSDARRNRRGQWGTRGGLMARHWSERRGSNPRPSPWQGDALPTELLSLSAPLAAGGGADDALAAVAAGAEGQNRTDDTSIFSAVLYLLSYLGDKNIIITARRPVKFKARIAL